jgi:GNAT superfamily N-acetyltransferase
MAYEIVPYAPAFDAQIARVQTHLWSADESVNRAYFKWKYVDNPYLDDVPIQLALHGRQVVAMRGMFGALWEIGAPGARHLIPYADDFVVAPEHRNRGVAAQVMQATLEAGARRGFAYTVSLSAGAVTLINSLAAGWRSAGSYRPVRRHRPATLLERISRRARRMPGGRTPGAAPAPIRQTFERFDRDRPHAREPVSFAAEPRAEEMAALIARLPWDGRIRHVRDAEYLAWRFRNPLHEYRFVFWDEDGLRGYLVLQRYRSERADQTCVNIVDWEAAGERIRAALLQAALERGGFERVDVWTVGLKDATTAVLQLHGFASAQADSIRAQSRLLVRRLGEGRAADEWKLGGRNLLDITDWDLRMLYSMAG